QDGEQNIFGQIAFGMDEADYCIMRAPKPTLICAGTRDVTFDFGGTWELFRDAKRFYSRIGHPDMVDLAAPDAPHGFTLQLREAVTRFMARHLLGKDIVVREVDKLPDSFTDEELRNLSVPDWTAEQLQCVPQGQVMLMRGERSVFQINAEIAQQLKAARSSSLDRKVVREVIGASEMSPEPRVKTIEKIPRNGYSVEKLTLEIEDAFQVPALLYVPAKPNGRAVLYLQGMGLKADVDAIESLARDGHLVLAAELRGLGETETGLRRKSFGAGLFGRDNLEIFTAYLIGKSYVGMRTDDVRSWLRVLKTKSSHISLIAVGEAAIPALHAAALEPDEFQKITLRQMLPSWESLVGADGTVDQTVNMVHGVLKHYDLPELIRLVGQDRVLIEQPIDGLGAKLE
ncbi:MAG: hypothetical protein IT423_09010, partial [Pirellulaceae bacterium]|nr:hypothetical protein [Pirellulaceae bacterium]